MCYPDRLSSAREASQNLTVNPIQIRRKRGGQKDNRNARKHGFYSIIWTWSVIWALAFELCLPFASMRQSASPHGSRKINGSPTKRIVLTLTTKRQSSSPRLAKTNGNPTKRIVRTLTTESAAASDLTYQKELLNSRENSHFYKTNHPGTGNNGGLGSLIEDLISHPNNAIFRIYAQDDKSGGSLLGLLR
jgi:hypothetical protein